MAKLTFTYNLTPRDAAWHSDISGEGYFEWWYLDAVFKEGYQLAFTFFASMDDESIADQWGGGKGEPGMGFRINTPDGQVFRTISRYPMSTFSASTETMDVKIAGSTLKGSFTPERKLKEFYVKVREGDLGADLTYFVEVTGVKQADRDGGYTYYNPVKKKVYGWYPVAPRCRVEGKLYIKGKTIDVHGWGYQDHQLGNYSTADVMTQEFWGHFVAGEYTAVWTDSYTNGSKNYSHYSPFVLWKGDKPLLNTYQFSCVPEKFAIEPNTKMPYAVVETLRASDGETHVKAVLLPGKVIDDKKYLRGKFTEDVPGAYFRQFCDVELEITRGDKVERVKGEAIHEHGWHDDWFPYKK